MVFEPTIINHTDGTENTLIEKAELARLRDVEKKVKQMIVFQDSDDLDAEQKATFLYAGMQILRDLTKDQ